MKKLLLFLFIISFHSYTQDTIPAAKSVVALDKMNVVYRGVPNPISIAVNNAKSYVISGKGVSKKEDGSYVLRPGSGNETKVFVEIENFDGSKVIGMTTNREGQLIMVVTEKGYGKMSPIDEYRVSNRGGKGVKTINVTERNGQIVAIRAVEGNEDLLIITDDGIVIRLPMEQVKTAGRATQGVRLIKVHDSKVSSVEVVAKNEEEVVEEGEEESE